MHKRMARALFGLAPLLLALCFPMTGCTFDVYPQLNSKPGHGTWVTGCQFSNGEGLDVAMRGLSRLRITTPCPQLSIASHYMGTGTGILNGTTDFDEVLSGRNANWSWQILGTSAVENVWTKQRAAATPEHKDKPYGPAVSWPKMFETLRAVYRYVLDGTPPASEFSLYFFSSDLSANRKEFTDTRDSLSLPLYLPFDVSLPTMQGKTGKPQLNSMQSAYVQALQVVCFEYMHALFFAKKLKPMNMLTQSVADSVTCTGAALVAFRSDPNFAMIFPAANSLDITSARELAKQQNDVDHIGAALGTKNIAHMLGGDTKSVRVSAGDTATVQKILQLSRAMLQDPVDLSYQLYPLKRVEAQPAYAATSAATASGG